MNPSKTVPCQVTLEPYSLSPKGAEAYFGIPVGTFYNMINDGVLIIGKHYLRIGRRLYILRDGFSEWMRTEGGVY